MNTEERREKRKEADGVIQALVDEAGFFETAIYTKVCPRYFKYMEKQWWKLARFDGNRYMLDGSGIQLWASCNSH